ncbi:MAG: hypothetical protein U0U25_09335 [Flavobacteriales bacterium]
MSARMEKVPWSSLLAWLILGATATAPLWFTYFLTLDGPMHVLHTCALKAQWFSGRYDTAQVSYDASDRFDPSDLLLMPLTVLCSPEQAHAAYASLALLTLFAGIGLATRSLGRSSAWAMAWCAPLAWSYVLILGFLPFVFAVGWALVVVGWWNGLRRVEGRHAWSLLLGAAIAQWLHRSGGTVLLLGLCTTELMRWAGDRVTARERLASLPMGWRWAAVLAVLGALLYTGLVLARTPITEMPAPRDAMQGLLSLRAFLLLHAEAEAPHLLVLGGLLITAVSVSIVRRLRGMAPRGAADGLWVAALLLFAASVLVDTPYARLLFLPIRAQWLAWVLLGCWTIVSLPRTWWAHALVAGMVVAHGLRIVDVEQRMAGSRITHEELLAAVDHLKPHGVVMPFNRDDNWLHDHLGAYLAARYEGVLFSPHDHLRFRYAQPVATPVRLFGTGPQHGLRWLEAHVAGGGPPVIDHVVLIGHGDRPDERYRNLERVLVRHFGLTWRNRYVEIWTRNGAGTTADHKDPGLNLAPPPRGRAE